MEETLLTVIITVVALTILACQQTLISPRRPSKRRRYDTTLLALIPSSQPAAMHALAAAALHTSGPGSFFALLSQSLDPLIVKKDTNYKPAIETQRRLAVFLDFLAHGGSYRQGGDDYYNRKQFASLTGQFTADAHYRCLDLLWGYPGSVHDSRMFRNSSLKKRIVSGDIPLLSMPPIQLADDSIPYYLLADSGYSNTAYLLTPFDHRSDLSPEQRVYNKQLSSAHMVVKLMVGMVKARWGLLLGPMRTSLDMDWWQAYEQRQRGPEDEPEQQQVGRELSPADEDGSNLRATMVSYTNRRH
ncbi:hypothetical protein N2152v2_004761 [Parachlorella kessleri]